MFLWMVACIASFDCAITAITRSGRGKVADITGQFGQALVDARQWPIDLGTTFHVQSLVRTILVEDLDEFVEASLLLQEVPCRGLSSFFFPSEVHAFMATVLLGMARFDAFDADPSTDS
jgi:hypothetical protein